MVEIIRVPTSSMSHTITSKYVFVNKTKPGIAFYKNNREKYFRLKIGKKLNRNNIVYFHLPETDSLSLSESKDYTIKNKPKTVSRIIGLPGENIKIEKGNIFINDSQYDEKLEVLKAYKWLGDNMQLRNVIDNYKDIEYSKQNSFYILNIPNSKIKEFEVYRDKLSTDIVPVNIYDKNTFPFTPKRRWSAYNMGEILIPKKGMTIDLNVSNFDIYKTVIQIFENENVEIKGNYIFRNNIPISKYTFKLDYYWVQGDNQFHSFDSRYWGFLPESHIIGVVKEWHLIRKIRRRGSEGAVVAIS